MRGCNIRRRWREFQYGAKLGDVFWRFRLPGGFGDPREGGYCGVGLAPIHASNVVGGGGGGLDVCLGGG